MVSRRYVPGRTWEATLYGPSQLALSIELAIFHCASYGFHTTKNKITGLNKLHPYCAIMEACDAELVEGFSKKSVPTNNTNLILEILGECCR